MTNSNPFSKSAHILLPLPALLAVPYPPSPQFASAFSPPVDISQKSPHAPYSPPNKSSPIPIQDELIHVPHSAIDPHSLPLPNPIAKRQSN